MRYVAHIHMLDLLDTVVIYAEVVGADSFQRELEPAFKECDVERDLARLQVLATAL